jgi:hypothetical protein
LSIVATDPAERADTGAAKRTELFRICFTRLCQLHCLFDLSVASKDLATFVSLNHRTGVKTQLRRERRILAAISLFAAMFLQSTHGQGTGIDALLIGTWTYRSWLDDPMSVDVGTPEQKCDHLTKLLFAEAELVIEDVSKGQLRGKLRMGELGSLTLFGSASYGQPFSVRFQGVGKDSGSPSEGWVYDYIGWVIPVWPNGVAQRTAIVGSVVRTVAHSNGQAKAGKVASFIAIKKD